MLKKQYEKKQLERGWRIVLLIWGAILASLGIYIGVCWSIREDIQINVSPDFPLETLQYILVGVTVITLVAVYYLRKFLLRPTNVTSNAEKYSSAQQLALNKYTATMVVTSALVESIAIYGVVLFFLSKDISSLYQLSFMSAVAMIYFRPRKSELLDLVTKIEKQCKL
ncbi:hypothetical protein [Desulfogranum japonicum]|uniref:hypothetical protein n=1 Tax=Desulfogranum japonicum TaxID=231447 RepID=UPI00040BE6D6|nr:hypothetical protein [Desulfogranum japonicum]